MKGSQSCLQLSCTDGKYVEKKAAAGFSFQYHFRRDGRTTFSMDAVLDVGSRLTDILEITADKLL